MSEDNLDKRFLERARQLLVTLPYDMKVLFEAMSDEDLPMHARQLAASGVIYCLAPSDPIPDTMGLVGFVDDLVVVRVVLAKMLTIAGEDMADYPERFRDQFEGLDGDIELFRSFFGDTMLWVDWRLEKISAVKYKGKGIDEYLTDDESGQRLYEDGLEFTTEYEIDDDAAAKLQTSKSVLDAFRKVYEVEVARQQA